MKTKIYSRRKTILSDLHTPVGVFAKIRREFPEAFLLESNDYLGEQSAHSFICVNPIAHFTVTNGFCDSSAHFEEDSSIAQKFSLFLNAFDIAPEDISGNGIFGFTTYDAVQYFETITFAKKEKSFEIPEICYFLFGYVLRFDHFRHTLTIIKNSCSPFSEDEIVSETLHDVLFRQAPPPLPFRCVGDEISPTSDADFVRSVEKLKRHVLRGDIFQVVPSKRFTQKYQGDDFQVYRSLRSINPSPYLFYFDFAHFRLFGSSPEAHLLVNNGKAVLNPIAGTTKRSNEAAVDKEKIAALLSDPKEGAEHVMLVDLARNDLSRSCYPVSVKQFKEPHVYSHVIHLVSTVVGQLTDDATAMDVFQVTFPAGTVSGAPKFRAMQLIDEVETVSRSFYAGAVGFFGFDGSTTHAITIRSFLSKDHTLTYQAGAGVVADSIPEKELEEVNNKLHALRQALVTGETIDG